MEGLRIVLLCTAGAVLYGILHDQVTARICVEYFTIGHPPLVQSESPTVLALAWGVAATWWVGCGMGLLLAAASRVGSLPTLTAREQLRPLLWMLGAVGVASLLGGIAGYTLATDGKIVLAEPWRGSVPASAHVGFLTDLWAHNAGYLAAFVGGILLCVRALRQRWLRAQALRVSAPGHQSPDA